MQIQRHKVLAACKSAGGTQLVESGNIPEASQDEAEVGEVWVMMADTAPETSCSAGSETACRDENRFGAFFTCSDTFARSSITTAPSPARATCVMLKTTAREPKRTHLTVPAFKKPPKLNEKTPRETQKERNGGGRGKKKAKFWAPHPSRPHPSGPHPSGPFFWVWGPHPCLFFWFFFWGEKSCLWFGRETKTPIWAKVGLAKVSHPNFGQSRSIKVGWVEGREEVWEKGRRRECVCAERGERGGIACLTCV